MSSRGGTEDLPFGTDVTHDQQKRLARLAKMGIGPIAGPGGPQPAISRGPQSRPQVSQHDLQSKMEEKRRALMEQERRMRLEEEAKRQDEDDSLEQFSKKAKGNRNRAGLTSLGAVQPREEPVAFFPTPASASEAFQRPVTKKPGGQMAIKISSEAIDKVSGEVSKDSKEPKEDDIDDDDDDDDEPDMAQALAALKKQKQTQPQKKPNNQPAEPKKKGKKRKKNKRQERDADDEDDSSDDEDSADKSAFATAQAKKQSRDGGISWSVAALDSVKGKVSSDNKGMTDAELERRFGSQGSDSNRSGLMSEAQVKAMLQKERKSSKAKDHNAKGRVQRELEEWTKSKAEKVARMGNEREHLVVSRK
eukprot:TRINITY_DN50985_c0_g1_i1.p1 TRINITY_DN50985_c0_g1~~TRINITY_DN50985_c0_g1_i1.p1  ORF type:complete len:363 (+),score=109.46 TRINITY_DN50985_c0_g1_i1:34-1122(+)